MAGKGTTAAVKDAAAETARKAAATRKANEQAAKDAHERATQENTLRESGLPKPG